MVEKEGTDGDITGRTDLRDDVAYYKFNAGDILEVNKNPNSAAMIHVTKTIVDEEPALKVTVVPIAYGPYRLGDQSTFSIEPPQILNPGKTLPIWK